MVETPTAIGDVFQVNADGPSTQTRSSVATFSDGSFIVVWQSSDQDGSGSGIYAQRYEIDGKPVGGEFRINSRTLKDQTAPSVAALADDGFIVAWESKDTDGSGLGVFARRFDADGNALGTDFQVNSYSEDDQDAPAVAALQDGGFVVTWESHWQDAKRVGVYGQRFDASGAFLGDEFPVGSSDSMERPNVATLADGKFVVVWDAWGDGSDHGVFGQMYGPKGIAIGTAFQINTITQDSQDTASVAALTTGGFAVIWETGGISGDETPIGSDDIAGQLFDETGAMIGNEFRVNTYVQGAQWNPATTAMSDGGFLVSWVSSFQVGSLNVFGQRFDGDALRLGSEFQISPDDFLSFSPAVAALDFGFAAFWTNNSGDGVNILAQRYAPEIWGTTGDDVLTDTTGVNWIHARSGNDIVNGKAGADLIYGGNGNDIVNGGVGADQIIGGNGNDKLFGEGGDDQLSGWDGRDRLLGGDGDDMMRGGKKADLLKGHKSDDLLAGNGGADQLNGGFGVDLLDGGLGDDILFGGPDSDGMTGGDGMDLLTGGSGDDYFAYFAATESTNDENRDEILDFEIGIDKIAFFMPAASALTFVGGSDFSGTGPEIQVRKTASGNSNVRVDIDGDGTADMRILVDGVVGLSADDFLF